MYRLVTLTLAVLLFAPVAFGQIEMTSASSGMVGMGVVPKSDTQLYVKNDTGGSAFQIGLRAETTGSLKAYGVYATSATTGGTSVAMFASASGGGTSRGVYGSAFTTSGQTGYGIFGTASGAGTLWAGYFSGNVHATGEITWDSDAMFKENIRGLEVEQDSQGRSIVERFRLLQPIAYTFIADPKYEHINLPDGEQFGLISQDVETVFPELVSEVNHPPELRAGTDGEIREAGESIVSKALNYVQLVPILIHVVQRQQAEIDELRALVEGMGGGN